MLCLVGREICLFLHVDASKVPLRQRESFVELAVKRHAPFEDPEHGIAWTGGQASVWYWPSSRARSLAADFAAPRTKYVPEALFLGEPANDGAQLLSTGHGVEGRIWSAGAVTASRWWTALPGSSEWDIFLRGSGLPASPPPDPVACQIQPRKWNTSQTTNATPSLGGLDAYAPKISMAIGLAFAGYIFFTLGLGARALLDTWQANRKAEQLSAPLRKILDARNKAENDLASVEGLLSLRDNRPQLKLMAEVIRLMPGKDWQIKQWEQSSPDRLDVTLSMPRPDPQVIVSQWEESKIFKDVRTELPRQPNEIIVHAGIVPPGEAK